MFEEQKVREIQEAIVRSDQVIAAELANVDFENYIEETLTYGIKPTIVVERSGQRIAVYGIYNKETGIRESESRQIGGAQEWLKVLTNDAAGLQEDLPGLVVPVEELPK